MINFKKFLPDIIAIIVFAALSYFYFAPVMSGKVLHMQDMMQAKAMSKVVDDYRAKTGVDPLWTSSMFSGMPAYQIAFGRDRWFGAWRFRVAIGNPTIYWR